MSLETTITLSRPGSKPHDPPVDLVIPNQLGSVKLLNQIGQGGMGIVYRGRDEMLKREVAVKFLTNAIPNPDDPNFQTFLEGARAAAAIQHPSLTTIFQAGVVEEIPYIVMQLVDGPTISDLIKKTGPLNQHEALAILIDVAAAIAELHDRGIIHRDIKPSNVLLDPEGKIIVTDFGLAHRRRQATSSQISSGTPAYMAPEMQGGEVSPRTDVYALGIMGFELLAGHLPFRGDVTEIQTHHKTTAFPIADLKDIPHDIADILERATHKNHLFRHKSARQFLRALQSATDTGENKLANARYSLLQRLRSLSSPTSHPPTLPSSNAPEGSTYFDHLSKIAASKRSQRPAIEPPPPPTPRHCLLCGYNRRGLPDENPCPECGTPWDFNERQSTCSALANQPKKLWWHLVTLRPLPSAWWEVFDRPGLHKFTPPRTALIICIAALLTAAIMALFHFVTTDIQVHRTATAYLYRTGDPTHTKVRDYGGGSETTSFFDRAPRGTHVIFPPNPMSGLSTHVDWTERIFIARPKLIEYIVYPASITIFLICGWIIYRHLWLNLLLRYNRNLTPQERQSARRAAAPLSLIFLALPIGTILFIVLALLFYRLINFPTWGFFITILFMLAYPATLLLRTLRADTARHIFPHRSLTHLLLAAALFLHFLLILLCTALANALVNAYS